MFTLPFNQGEQMASRFVNCVHPFNQGPNPGNERKQAFHWTAGEDEDRKRGTIEVYDLKT